MRVLSSAVALMVALFAATGAVAAETVRQIVVQGSGQVEAAPDMATISVGVTTQARMARDALDENSRRMSAVMGELGDAGVSPRDMQTSGLSLFPQWSNRALDNGSRSIVGYQVNNQLSVRVRDLASLGDILGLVAGQGANQFNGLSFGVAEAQQLEDSARAAAVADGLRKAEVLASAAGVTLGSLISLNESGASAPMPMARAEMAMAADSVPVAGGEIVFSARVTLVFAIDD